MNVNQEYEQCFSHIFGYIENFKNQTALIKEKALLETYWGIGEELLMLKPLTDGIVEDFTTALNKQLESDPIFKDDGTNKHWVKLSACWIEDHRHHDRSIVLSGKADWPDWALILDIVKSPTHRYWLVCRKIKNKWGLTYPPKLRP